MESLENHFLIAMPSLKDPFFKRSVTYLCEHNDDGAMGLIINIPVDLTLADLLKQLDIDIDSGSRRNLDSQILQGGPVAPERGFVLHTPQFGYASSMELNDQLMVTTSKDILEVLGTASEPDKYLVTLGYAGWSPGQLEQELSDNSWLTIPASNDIIFDTPLHQRWELAAKRLGIDIWQLTGDAGHA